MALDRAHAPGQSSQTARLTTAGIINRLSRFDGPPEEFLVNLLAVQCRLAAAERGVVLRAGKEDRIELLAMYPRLAQGDSMPGWLTKAVEVAAEVLSAGATAIKPVHEPDSLYGQAARRHLIMMPIFGDTSVRGLAAYLVESSDETVLAHCRERLELSISLLSLYEMRLTLQRRQYDLRRLRMAMETLSAVNEHDRSAAATMAFCNEVASRWQCDRVSLGFLKGRYVQLKALSHTEKFSRKMKLVRDIEAAMEECFDQDVEILYPPFPEAAYVSRATAELARLHGPVAIVSLPLRRSGKVTGVVTMERPKDLPFVVDEVESLRLTCDLCTARLANLHESDRWFGARAAESMRKTFSLAVGPKHTWAKVAAAVVCAFLIYIFVAKGDYRANASFVLEAQQQQMISAPFDGYIEAVYVEPGDKVISDQTVLAKLETTRLASDLDKARADLARAQIEADTAMRDGETAKAQDARAQAGKAQAEIEELGRLIREASIKSPITGTIVSPDIKRRVRGHVGLGDVMFEVAPVEFLRAELSVPEDEIADVVAAFEAAMKEGKGLGGQLATVGEPGKRIDFVVERINPVAEVEEKQNVFKVRVRLPEVQEGMRAGTRGVAKIDLGHRRYAYLWTRKLVNWVRMRLWL